MVKLLAGDLRAGQVNWVLGDPTCDLGPKRVRQGPDLVHWRLGRCGMRRAGATPRTRGWSYACPSAKEARQRFLKKMGMSPETGGGLSNYGGIGRDRPPKKLRVATGSEKQVD